MKALDLERKQVRRAGDAYRYQLHLEADAFIERHRKEMRELRETFAPTLERLISVRIGVPFYVQPVRVISPRAIERDAVPAMAEVYTIDTANLVRLCIDIRPDLVLFAFGGDSDVWCTAERELQRAAGVLVTRLMETARTGRREMPRPAGDTRGRG